MDGRRGGRLLTECCAGERFGYDIELHVTPDEPGTMTFEAHTAGRFPVGIHGTGGHGHGNVVYLEVHPR